MKRIITLFIASLASVIVVGQVSQTFESIASLSTLTNSCWQFSGATLSTATPVEGIVSLSLNPTTSSSTASLTTPFINLKETSTIGFDYKLSKPLGNTSSRKVAVRLLGVDGTSTEIASLSLDDRSNTSISRFSGKVPAAGIKQLTVEVTAAGDEAAVIYIDNVTIDGSFIYTAPYGCKEMGDGTLSIHYLKTFQGTMTGDKVQLQWSVAENENNNIFELEKSTDGNEFKSIATIKATARVAQETYNYSEQIQGKAYYRLKVISRSNIRMYSHVLFFKSGTATSGNLVLLQNPVWQSLRFGFVADEKTAAILTIYNQSGTSVFKTSLQAGKGYNAIIMPLDMQLQKGLYFLDVITNGKHSSAKFIKD